MLTLVLAVSSFVCPPVEEALMMRLAGEKCGGTCNSYGECAKGLECHVEKTTSPFSFAILQGASKAGVCVEVAFPVEDAPAVDKEGRGLQLAGGQSAADIESTEVQAAAKFAVASVNSMSNSLDALTMTRIESATQQVVAGIKYTLVISMSDGKKHQVQIVDQPWMNPRYTLIADDML